MWETRSVFHGVWNTQTPAQVSTHGSGRVPHPVTVHSPFSAVLLWVALQTLAKAKRKLADEFQDGGSIREPIQPGRGQAFVAKDLGPLGKAPMGGEDQGHPFVEGRAELKQQMRPGGSERDEAQLVHHDEVLLERRGQHPRQSMVILGLDQCVDQSRRGRKPDRRPVPAGR